MRGVILDADTQGDASLEPVMAVLEDWQVYGFSEPHQVAERIREADIVLTNKSIISSSALTEANHLKFIGIMATGTNIVDLDAANRSGIIVSNTRGYSTASVAQHTMSLILNLATRLPSYFQDVTAGKWQQSQVFSLLDHPIIELDGKALGIVGHGDLGSAVGRIAAAFGMRVLVSARPGQSELKPGQTLFEDLLEEVDFLTLHCPLTSENGAMLNRKTLALMSPNAYLINTARGGLIDSLALIEAIENKTIAGAALDVLAIEPPLPGDPLIEAATRLPNLLISPHSAWGASESRQRLILQVANNIRLFLAGTPRNVVSS
ncbi:MAG: glycerate dehydrogenase [Patiriisocius sp.]